MEDRYRISVEEIFRFTLREKQRKEKCLYIKIFKKFLDKKQC